MKNFEEVKEMFRIGFENEIQRALWNNELAEQLHTGLLSSKRDYTSWFWPAAKAELCINIGRSGFAPMRDSFNFCSKRFSETAGPRLLFIAKCANAQELGLISSDVPINDICRSLMYTKFRGNICKVRYFHGFQGSAETVEKCGGIDLLSVMLESGNYTDDHLRFELKRISEILKTEAVHHTTRPIV